ncbi:MAG: hypothetical protein O7B99_00690 [Planctomycetota bacterium]|nr:hypothetical protein [Planctomycetota bacterium]
MIQINLLPQEYRQKKRAPLKMMVVTALSVALNASLAAYWAWTMFGVAAEVNSELVVLQDNMENLRPQIRYHEELQAESGLFRSREQTLEQVTGSRISWTHRIDDLVDVISKGGDGQKYLIWLDDLSVDQKANPRTESYGTFKARANSGSAVFAQVANFLEDIENSPLLEDFNPPAPPDGSLQMRDEDLMPPQVWSFPVVMTLKAPELRGPLPKVEASE